MATYKELSTLQNNSDLQEKVEVAVTIAAIDISQDAAAPANQPQRLKWAKRALENPKAIMREMLPAVLALNEGATATQIESATDAAVLANVKSTIDLFADQLV